jgi:hypothetical protein
LPGSWRTAEQSRMQSSDDPPNAQKSDRTGTRTPERAKKLTGEQKNSKKRKKTQKSDKNICQPGETVFIRTPSQYS